MAAEVDLLSSLRILSYSSRWNQDVDVMLVQGGHAGFMKVYLKEEGADRASARMHVRNKARFLSSRERFKIILAIENLVQMAIYNC